MAQERRKRVTPVRVSMYCDCGGEFILGNGTTNDVIAVLLSNPPKYPHTCNKCGKQEYFVKEYPYIDYEEYNMFKQF